MTGYLGMSLLDSTLRGPIVTRHPTTGVPTAPDGSVSYSIYGPTGAVPGGSGTLDLVDSDVSTKLFACELVLSAENGYAPGEQFYLFIEYTVAGLAVAEAYVFDVA